MLLGPRLRKLTLTAHVVSSVGWLGAVLVFLALAVAALVSEDPAFIRGGYLTMEFIGWFVLLPLSLTAFVSGLIQSLGTPWGLVRHYWVIVKLIATVLATVILLMYTETLGYLADGASDPALSPGALLDLRSASPVLHAATALVVLLGATVLSIYKPAGTTRFGRRRTRST